MSNLRFSGPDLALLAPSVERGRSTIETMSILIDRLNDLASEEIADLLADGERSGSRIVRRLVEDWDNAINRFNQPGEALFAAWVDGLLAGVCGLNIDPYAGNERVGRVRHLYVALAFRRRGVGRQLVMHVIDAARSRFDDLHLRTNNPVAARLYEKLGFVPCDGSDDSTHVAKLAASPNLVVQRTGARVAHLPTADRER